MLQDTITYIKVFDSAFSVRILQLNTVWWLKVKFLHIHSTIEQILPDGVDLKNVKKFSLALCFCKNRSWLKTDGKIEHTQDTPKKVFVLTKGVIISTSLELDNRNCPLWPSWYTYTS